MKNRIENTMTAPQSGLWDAMIASIGYYQMPHIKAMKLIVEFVVENRLATDFSIPDAFGDDVFVPKIASDAQTNGTLSEDEWQPTGPFGRLITEWPLPTNSSS